jgi:CheY-like chemotaxis protein
VLAGLLEGPELSVAAAPWRGDPAAFAAQHSPDLILLQVEAADPADEQRVERLRQHPGLAGVPVVLLSSADEWTLRAFTQRCGATGYLAQSALGGDLKGIVRRLL